MEIIIETPRNSREKYEYVEETKDFRLRKILPLGMVFPYDFGFIPDTKGEDGDPLDALVISEFETFPGCRVQCRLIGVLKATQKEENKTIRNDRYFFIPRCSVMFNHIQSMKDFPSSHNEELLYFFMAYNDAIGKKFHPIKIHSPEKAKKMLGEKNKE